MTEDGEREMKRCPFCGRLPAFRQGKYGTIVECRCEDHWARCVGKTLDEAVEKWEKRAAMTIGDTAITVEELTKTIKEQFLTLKKMEKEKFDQKERIQVLESAVRKLRENLDAAMEAAGKATEDRKILKEKTDAQEKRIEDLQSLLDDQLKTKEQNRRYRKIILKMAALLYDAH